MNKILITLLVLITLFILFTILWWLKYEHFTDSDNTDDIGEKHQNILEQIKTLNENTKQLNEEINDLQNNKIPKAKKKIKEEEDKLRTSQKMYEDNIEGAIEKYIINIQKSQVKCMEDKKNIDDEMLYNSSKMSDFNMKLINITNDTQNKNNDLERVTKEYNEVTQQYNIKCAPMPSTI
jgi:DNA repair exonuclease SbcCD ATPase subunit